MSRISQFSLLIFGWAVLSCGLTRWAEAAEPNWQNDVGQNIVGQDEVGQDANQDKDWPAGIAPREKLSKARSYDYDFSNVSISTLQTWLGRIGVKVPVELGGNLSGWVWVQRSAQGWLDFKNYKIEGQIKSPDLKIETWQVKAATLRFGYFQNNWYVGKISGQVRSVKSKNPIGQANANVKILDAADSKVSLDANIDSIDLKELLKALGLALPIENSGGTVSLTAELPMKTLTDIGTWNATVKSNVGRVTIPWLLSPANANVILKLNKGAWRVSEGQIQIAQQPMTVTGQGKLIDKFPFQLEINGAEIDARQLTMELKQPELASQIAGTAKLSATIKGDRIAGLQESSAVLAGKSLTLRSRTLKDYAIAANYDSSGVEIQVKKSKIAGGSVSGNVKWLTLNQLATGIPSSADLEIESVSLDQVFKSDLPVSIAGMSTGNLHFETKLRDDKNDWASSGSLKVEPFSLQGTRFGAADISWSKSLLGEELTTKASLKNGNGSVDAEVVVKLKSDGQLPIRGTEFSEYSAVGTLKEYDLVARIAGEVIPMRVIGTFEVDGTESNWLKQGRLELSKSAAKLGDRMLNLEMAKLSFNESEFRVERFRLLDSNGRIAGSASIRRDQIGKHLINLRVVDFTLGEYLNPWIKRSGVQVEGMCGLEIRLQKGASEPLSRDWNGQIKGQLKSLTINQKKLGPWSLNGSLTDQILSANVQGEIAAGATSGSLTFPLSLIEELSGNSSAELQSSKSKTPNLAILKLTIAKAQIEKVASLLAEKPMQKDLKGTASLEVDLQGTTTSDLVASCQLDIPSLVNRNGLLVRNLKTRLSYSDKKLKIENLSSGFAGGRIDAVGRASINMEKLSSSTARINFVAQRLDAEKLTSLVTSQYADSFSGSLDYRGTITIRRGIRVRGSARAKDGLIFGIPIQVAGGELQAEFKTNGEFVKLESNDLHGKAIGGIFEASAGIRGGSNYSLEANGKISRGRLEELSKAVGFENIGGRGTFSGRFQLASDRIEEIRDLEGAAQIQLENGDVNSLPLLSSIDRFVPLAQFASTDIESGQLNARIGQGQLRVTNLLLNSQAFTLAASGNASLDGSKLDLELVLETGGTIQQQLSRSAVQRLLLTSIPQLALLAEINEVIRNRSIFLHVGGSASRPVIQANAARTAARAFLENFSRGVLGTSRLFDPSIPDTN